MAKKEEKDQIIGRVTHYFDKAGVAVIECLKGKISVGDNLILRRGDHQVAQIIESLQIDHESVESIKKGDEAGLKVAEPVREGYEVLKG